MGQIDLLEFIQPIHTYLSSTKPGHCIKPIYCGYLAERKEQWQPADVIDIATKTFQKMTK